MANQSWTPQERYDLIQLIKNNKTSSEWALCKRHGYRYQRSTPSVHTTWRQFIKPVLIDKAGWENNIDDVEQEINSVSTRGRVIWTDEEDAPLLEAMRNKKPDVTDTDAMKVLFGTVPNRTNGAIRNRWITLKHKIEKGIIKL